MGTGGRFEAGTEACVEVTVLLVEVLSLLRNECSLGMTLSSAAESLSSSLVEGVGGRRFLADGGVLAFRGDNFFRFLAGDAIVPSDKSSVGLVRDKSFSPRFF